MNLLGWLPFNGRDRAWSDHGSRARPACSHKLLLLALGLSAITTAQAATRYAGTCGTPNSATIAAAITAASAGDTILVCPGTWNEAVTVSKDNLTMRSSTGNRADVTVTNSGIPFSLTGAGTTIKDMTIVSTNNKGINRGWTASPSAYTFENLAITAKEQGVYVDVSAKVTFTNVNVTSSNDSAIELRGSTNGAHVFDTVTASGKKYGLYTYNGGVTFKDINASANNDDAIYMNPGYDATFTNVTATSTNDDGIYLAWVASSKTFSFSNVNVTAKDNGIYIDVSDKVTFSNVNVTSSNDDGIRLAWGSRGQHVFDTVTASGKKYGIYSSHGGVTFKDITVTANDEDALYLAPEYDAAFTNITATSVKGDGIYMTWAASGKTLNLDGLNVSAKKRGVYVEASAAVSLRNAIVSSSDDDAVYLGYGAQGAHVLDGLTLNAPNGAGIYFGAAVPSSTIGNVCVDSSQKGVYVPQWNAKNVTISNSKFVSTSYGVQTAADPTNRTSVSGSCFMKSSAPRAYSSSTSHKFDGNYWQGVAGGTTYVDGNVRDNSTLASCPVTSCYTTPAPGPDHIRLVHDGSAIACSAESVTLQACANADCSSFYTGGVTGNVTAGANSVAFSIPSGSSSASLSIYLPTDSSGADPQTIRLGANAISPTPSNATSPYYCNNGSTVNYTTACDLSVSKAGFLFTVPTLAAGIASGAVDVQAVKSADSTTCVPLFQNVTRTLAFWGSYQDPASGTLAVKVNGSNIETTASPAYTSTYTLSFDGSGKATLSSVAYDDVGRMRLNARYVGSTANTPPDGGMIVTGLSDFVVKPYGFKLGGSLGALSCALADQKSAAAGAFCVAGGTFTGTVQAVKFDAAQTNNLGAVTPNFGHETTPQTVTFAPAALVAPTTAAGGTLSAFTSSTMGSFSGTPNQATATMIWPNVGTITIKPTMDYLGAGDLTSGGVSDSTAFTGNVGRFYPDHFTLASGSVTAGCGGFTYMDQPNLGIDFTVEARNKADALTTNYLYAASGGYGATLAAVSKVAENANAGTDLAGRISNLAVPAWAGGQYHSASTATFARNANPDGSYESLVIGIKAADDDAALTGLNMRATTTGDCVAASNCDAATVGAATKLHFGRLRLSNAFGSEKADLSMAVQAQYWTGNSWLAAGSDDTCTNPILTAVNTKNAIALSGYASTNPQAPLSDTTLGNSHRSDFTANGGGQWLLTLTKPDLVSGKAPTGSVDVAINLGSGAADVSCLGSHPATTGLGLPWLRSRNGNCASTYDRDPSARATFGVFAPETRRTVHVREQY